MAQLGGTAPQPPVAPAKRRRRSRGQIAHAELVAAVGGLRAELGETGVERHPATGLLLVLGQGEAHQQARHRRAVAARRVITLPQHVPAAGGRSSGQRRAS